MLDSTHNKYSMIFNTRASRQFGVHVRSLPATKYYSYILPKCTSVARWATIREQFTPISKSFHHDGKHILQFSTKAGFVRSLD